MVTLFIPVRRFIKKGSKPGVDKELPSPEEKDKKFKLFRKTADLIEKRKYDKDKIERQRERER